MAIPRRAAETAKPDSREISLSISNLQAAPAETRGNELEYGWAEPAARATVELKRGMINMQLLQHVPGFLVLLTALSSAAAGPVYTWVDGAGITYFSDTPPADESIGVRLINDLPPPAAGMPGDGDFYSVVNQAKRMETQRLLAEKLAAERLQAEAEASRAQAEALAAQQPVIQYDNEPDGYIYPYYPRYHHRPHGNHRPGDHKPARPHRPEHYSGSFIEKMPLPDGVQLPPAFPNAAIPESHRVIPD